MLAKLDLGQPKDAKQQLALADGWWELGGKDKNPARIAIQMRAMFWYDKAIPNLTGLRTHQGPETHRAGPGSDDRHNGRGAGGRPGGRVQEV